MNRQMKLDLLHKSRLTAIEATYRALIETISVEELSLNKTLRKEIRRIRRQIQMTQEVNKSFEF